MGLNEDLAAAKASRPEPVLVDVVVNDALYRVETRRLDGMQWAAVMAAAPPTDSVSVMLGYSPAQGALVACREYGRLFDADGVEQDMSPVVGDDGVVLSDPWGDVFDAISGTEIQAVASSWWGRNAGDPNQRVEALKKASRGGGKTK